MEVFAKFTWSYNTKRDKKEQHLKLAAYKKWIKNTAVDSN